MEDRFRPRLKYLGIPVLGILGVTLLRGRIGPALRLVGLWAYLATVNQGWPDRQVLKEAQQASAGLDVLVPYWGSGPRFTIEVPERELAPAERV